jgi:hypothetical protein
MGRLVRGWELIKESWAAVRRDLALIVRSYTRSKRR